MQKLEEELGYRFKDASLLTHALTHPSYSNENGEPKEASNQRLEFLGDSVLELSASLFLFAEDPPLKEGEMTRLRASLVCEKSLAEVARQFSISSCLMLGRGEAREGIQYKDSVLSDALESIIGAIYLDGGFSEADYFIRHYILSRYTPESTRDPKTVLQEYASRQHIELKYLLLEESGPEHRKKYRIAALLDGVKKGEGEGSSKKKAEQEAACLTLKEIGIGAKL